MTFYFIYLFIYWKSEAVKSWTKCQSTTTTLPRNIRRMARRFPFAQLPKFFGKYPWFETILWDYFDSFSEVTQETWAFIVHRTKFLNDSMVRKCISWLIPDFFFILISSLKVSGYSRTSTCNPCHVYEYLNDLHSVWCIKIVILCMFWGGLEPLEPRMLTINRALKWKHWIIIY